MRFTQVSSNQQYGRLIVQEQVDRNSSGHIRWLCNCECGGTAIVTSYNLRNGHTPGTGSYIYNGIDRVDNSKGYIRDNCVSCCKQCNIAKGALSLEEFLEWINRVSLAQATRLHHV